jgi:thioesterase domain-containing protein
VLSVTSKSELGLAEQKNLLAELLVQSSAKQQDQVYPASLAQQRLWFLEQLGETTAAYNVHLGFWLRGALDLNALQSSLRELVKRHESLRTYFRLEGRELVQVVGGGVQVNLAVTDMTDSGDYGVAYGLAKSEVERTFDLSNAPLFRTRLIRVTDNDHVLLLTMHHIITDSWSMQILAKELSALYTAYSGGCPSPFLELPITYGDYSEWQQKWFQTEKVHEQLSFWKEELEEAPPVLELRVQRPRAEEQTFQGASQTIRLSDEIISGIKDLAIRLQATPFMVLLAAFKVLLLRASGQPDLLVGVPVAGRNRVEVEGLVGFFVNTLVLRDDLSENPVFSDLVAQIRETSLGAFANSDVPFEKVVEVLQPERNLSYNPIFQVMFSVIKSAVQSHTFGDLMAWPYVVSPNTSIFDLSMTVIEGVDGLWWAQIDYNTDLFLAKDIDRLLNDYTELLQEATSHPGKRISSYGSAEDGLAARNEGEVEPKSRLPIAGGLLGIAARKAEGLGTKRKRRKKAKAQSTVYVKKSSIHSAAGKASAEELSGEEKLLVGIWKDLLRLPDVGLDDNFFEIGGHSLLAAQVIAQVQSAARRKIAVSAVFRAPTIRSFAQLLRENALSQPDPIAMKLKDGSGAVPFFGVAIPGVDTFGFAQMARHLPAEQTMYKLQAATPVVLGRPMTEEEQSDLAKQYVDAMRAEQRQGPYCLGAMCEGVLIAQQMILQLESQGEEVGLFAIFDTWVLENSQIRSLWAVDYYRQRLRNFNASSVNEKYATMRRLLRRVATPKHKRARRGWSNAYWPKGVFQAPKFQAPVLLFKRPRQPFFYVRDPNMGWGGRSLTTVTTCEIECGHVEMLREPHVHRVSETVAAWLRKIRNQEKTDAIIAALGGSSNSEMFGGTAA